MTFDLALRGGAVVTPGRVEHLDVYVSDGRIAALDPPHNGPHPARRVVEMDGRLLLPGMVDTHVHLMDPGDASREDFLSGTAAAAAAGVTTIVEHTHQWPVTTVERLREKRDHLEGRSHVDYGLAAHLWPDAMGAVDELWAAGVVFFKLFTCETHGVPAITGSRLVRAMEALARAGARALVHCEDELLTSESERHLHRRGRTDPALLVEWRSRTAEKVAVGTVAQLARLTGALATIAHVSHPAALDMLAIEQEAGSPAVAETCPQYLFLREDEVAQHGAFRKFTPPARARSEADAAEMWAAFNDGRIHLLSSDHAPSTAEHKHCGDIWSAPFGLPGLDTTLPLMLDAALRGRTTLTRLAAAYADAPARRYGLRGKGRIAVGADADLVVVDPTAEGAVDDAAIRSRAGWTPYRGTPLRGAVDLVLLRGEAVAEGGEVVDERAGRLLWGAGALREGIQA